MSQPEEEKTDFRQEIADVVSDPGVREKLKWAGAIAGFGALAAGIYFRNQIVDGFKKVMGKETEREKQEEVLTGMAEEPPDEFVEMGFAADAFDPDNVIKDRAVGYVKDAEKLLEEEVARRATMPAFDPRLDSVHMPLDAERDMVLSAIDREIDKEFGNKGDRIDRVLEELEGI